MKLVGVPTLLFAALACAAPSPQVAPSITLDQGTFVGASDSLTGTNKFLGIPFAQPPYAHPNLLVEIGRTDTTR